MENTKQPVVVKIAQGAGVTNTQQLRVYVTDSGGNITEQASFDGQEARLNITAGKLQGSSKVFIAHVLPAGIPASKLNERTLVQAGAYQLVKSLTENAIEVQHVPAAALIPIRWLECLVTGQVNKNFTIDGQTQNLPVCNARVHICNIERIFIWPIYARPIVQIPAWVLAEFKNKINEISQVVTKVPPGPGPVETQVVEKTKVQLSSLTPKNKLTTQLAKNNLQPLPEHVLSSINSASADTIKQTLVQYHDILYPYICLWPIFWFWFYRTIEEQVVTTDCNGHFEGWIPLFQVDHNVYIWVEANINGQWVTVYRPPLPCHTLWNYSCGTNINITVTDPRLTPCVCDNLPGEVVWVKRAGNGTSIRNIALNSSVTPSLFSDPRGLTNGYVPGRAGYYISPFTSSFPLYVQFGDGYPSAQVTHFRWQYRRVADGYLNTITEDFQYQQGALSKSYTYQGTDSMGNTVFYTGLFQLDEAIAGGKIYKIPNVDASVDTGIPTAEWNQDTATIGIDTTTLGDGLFEFVLQLLDDNGNVQEPSSSVFQIDSYLPAPGQASLPAGGIDAGYLYHGTDIAGTNDNNTALPITGFRFLIRLDNNTSTCSIADAVVDNNDGTGSTTDTQCGFAQYENKADGEMLLCFKAAQLHNYADYSFNVFKGNNNNVPVEQYSGQVPPPSTSTIVNGVTVTYQEDPTLLDLLGSCTQAAFAENLYVTAYHTDASERYSGFDSQYTAAFAIQPA